MKKILTVCLFTLTAGLLSAQQIEAGFGAGADYRPGAIAATAGLHASLWSPSPGGFQAGIKITAGTGFGDEVSISLLGRYEADFGVYRPVVSLGPGLVLSSRYRYLHEYPDDGLSGNSSLFIEAGVEPLRFCIDNTSVSALAFRVGTEVTEPFVRWHGGIDLISIGLSLKEQDK